MNPRSATTIQREGLNPPRVGSVPMLVDPRVEDDKNEVFYSGEAWRARCDEQNAWDADQAQRLWDAAHSHE